MNVGVTGEPNDRVVADSVDLDYDATLAFFQGRAEQASSASELGTTSYPPRLAVERDEWEWSLVAPWLHLDRRPAVLDVGCGVGRWARHLQGRIDRYVGVDFAPGIVDLARQTIDELGMCDVARAEVCSASDLGTEVLGDAGPFGLVIVSGVLAYLNDADLGRCLQGVVGRVAQVATVYVREPVALGDRLTLVGHWSTDLGGRYNAIYRKAADYRTALQGTLGAAGFVLAHDHPMDDTLRAFAETSQHFFVAERE